MSSGVARADPGFLEKGFICIKCGVVGVYLIFLKYPLKIKRFGFTETKLFHFHRIFKMGGGGGGGEGGRGGVVPANPLKPLDPPFCS